MRKLKYDFKNKVETRYKARQRLELNYVNAELNIRFYKEIIIPELQAKIGIKTKGKQDEENLKQYTQELRAAQDDLAQQERVLEHTDAFLCMLDE